jgi:hypothetical protein
LHAYTINNQKPHLEYINQPEQSQFSEFGYNLWIKFVFDQFPSEICSEPTIKADELAWHSIILNRVVAIGFRKTIFATMGIAYPMHLRRAFKL